MQDLERVLVVHADAEARRSIEDALRRIGPSTLSVYATGSLSEAAEKTRVLAPRVVLLGLDEHPAATLDLARTIRRTDRLLIGLYSPLVQGHAEGELLRAAARAGIGDFAPLPVSQSELAAALRASPLLHPESPPAREGHAFSFFSIKGGVGCTTVAANTAVALAAQQPARQTALFDGDIAYGTACQVVGLPPDRDLVDLVRDIDHPGPLDAYLLHHDPSGLLILPSALTPLEAERIAPDDVSRIVLALRRRFHTVVIDAPTRLDYLSLSLLDLSETVLVLTEAVVPTLARTAQLLRLLQDQGFADSRLRLILNRPDASLDGLLSERVVTEQLGRPLDLVIPYEKKAYDAVNRAVPLVLDRPRCGFSQAIQELARQLSAISAP